MPIEWRWKASSRCIFCLQKYLRSPLGHISGDAGALVFVAAGPVEFLVVLCVPHIERASEYLLLHVAADAASVLLYESIIEFLGKLVRFQIPPFGEVLARATVLASTKP